MNVTLTPEQVEALIKDCPPGETCTITLKPGDIGEDGSCDCEVVGETDEGTAGLAPEEAPASPEVGGDEAPPSTDSTAGSEPPPAEDPESKMLGYSRPSLLAARKKRSAPFKIASGADLED